MNFMFWLNLQPHNFAEEWAWLPKWRRMNWPIKTAPGHVWYVNFSWLNFGINLDNEW